MTVASKRRKIGKAIIAKIVKSFDAAITSDRDRCPVIAEFLIDYCGFQDHKGLWKDISDAMPSIKTAFEAYEAKAKMHWLSDSRRFKAYCKRKRVDPKTLCFDGLASLPKSLRSYAESVVFSNRKRSKQEDKRAIRDAMTAAELFDKDVRFLQTKLSRMGPVGVVASLAVRAQRASDKAKEYDGYRRSGISYRGEAYGRKEDAINKLVKSLMVDCCDFTWGYGIDESNDYVPDVLYIDLPTGQVSWHVVDVIGGAPRYPGVFDRCYGESRSRIIAFCQQLFDGVKE